jgi:hypothetical protein
MQNPHKDMGHNAIIYIYIYIYIKADF